MYQCHWMAGQTQETNRWLQSVTVSKGTSGKLHTAENLQALAKEAIEECQATFNCRVRSFATDNAANVSKMRQVLETDNSLRLIAYGCSAHLLNLFAHDVTVMGFFCYDKIF